MTLVLVLLYFSCPARRRTAPLLAYCLAVAPLPPANAIGANPKPPENRQNFPVDALGPVWQNGSATIESEIQFSFTRAASSTSGRAKNQTPISLLNHRVRTMKRTLPALLLFLLLAAPAAVHAQFTYTVNPGGTSVTITGYTGDGGAVIIPSSMNGLAVTSIGMIAFDGLTSLTSIAIPNSVTSIGEAAFGQTGLTNVTIPGSVTSLGAAAFQYCYNLKSVTIGGGVTSLADSVFYNCTSLNSVTISNGVSSIGDFAFQGCTKLTSITIPASVTSIDEFGEGGLAGAFSSCASLTSVYFQGNAPSVDSTVFADDNSNPTIYYLPGTTGWSSPFAGRQALLWNPLIQTIGSSFGVRSNQFGFYITGTPYIPIVVEACTNLASPLWIPLQSFTLTSGLVYFSDPQWTNYPSRFYRINSQ